MDWLGRLVGSSSSQLPYEIGPTADDRFNGGLAKWELRRGSKKDGLGTKVSIFKYDKTKSSPSTLAIAQNALRRMKTLRHPNTLAFLDGIESDKEIIIVTEEVTPLAAVISEMRRSNHKSIAAGLCSSPEVVWGFYCLTKAVSFLNMDCKLIHGNISLNSVFVTKGGDWKLGGFDLVSEMTPQGPSDLFTANDHLVDIRLKAPERAQRSWDTVSRGPPYALDVYSLAALMYEVGNGSSFRSPEQLQDTLNIPRDIASAYKRMIAHTPTSRIEPIKILESPYFRHQFVSTNIFFEEFALKDSQQKLDFFNTLPELLDNFPLAYNQYKLLPELMKAVEFGGAAGQDSTQASLVLAPIMKIGSLLPGEEYKTVIIPAITKLFSCNDRAMRYQLLQRMESFAPHLEEDVINNQIFDHIVTGFTDTSPILRELTVKGVLYIVEKLNKKNLNDRLVKYMARLQQDPEPAIRTNTTICIGRIASYMDGKSREKLLFQAFGKALRDPFPHARFAGLQALSACEEYFSGTDAAMKIIPAVSPMLLDPLEMVRTQASQCISTFLQKALAEAKEMTRQEALAAQNEGVSATQQAGGDKSVPEGQGSKVKQWGGWVASSIGSGVGKFVNSRGSMAVSGSIDQQSSSTEAPPSSSGNTAPIPSAPMTAAMSFAPSAPSSHATASTVVGQKNTWDEGWSDTDDLGLDSPPANPPKPAGPPSSSFAPGSGTIVGAAAGWGTGAGLNPKATPQEDLFAEFGVNSPPKPATIGGLTTSSSSHTPGHHRTGSKGSISSKLSGSAEGGEGWGDGDDVGGMAETLKRSSIGNAGDKGQTLQQKRAEAAARREQRKKKTALGAVKKLDVSKDVDGWDDNW